jgi:hypothetical protein
LFKKGLINSLRQKKQAAGPGLRGFQESGFSVVPTRLSVIPIYLSVIPIEFSGNSQLSQWLWITLGVKGKQSEMSL